MSTRLEKGERVRMWIELPGMPKSGHWEEGAVERNTTGWIEVITDNGGMISGPQDNFERIHIQGKKSGGQHAGSI